MSILDRKIDFAVVLIVNNANPNGDPLNGNRPRINNSGYGEISDVCIKRKMRNRFMEKGYKVFVQSDGNETDQYRNLRSRFEGEISEKNDKEKIIKMANEKWIDVRSFGQVFAFSKKSKGKKIKDNLDEDGEKGEENSVSIGIRGPVSIHSAFSVNVIDTTSIQITKSVSGEGDGNKKGSDTMGMKHRVDHGVYVFYGSINPQLASKTGFSTEDAEVIKDGLATLFENDASSARPEGSMEVYQLYWWEHNCKNGQYSSAKVHRELKISLKEEVEVPTMIQDYSIEINNGLEGLAPEIIDGR